MRIRHLAPAAIVLATGIVAAWGDDGGPTVPSDVSGEFTLQTVSGGILPYEVQQPPGAEVLPGAGALRLGSSDGLLLDHRDGVGTSTQEESGGRRLSASDPVHFGPDGTSPAHRGRLAGGIFTTVRPDGLILRFAR